MCYLVGISSTLKEVLPPRLPSNPRSIQNEIKQICGLVAFLALSVTNHPTQLYSHLILVFYYIDVIRWFVDSIAYFYGHSYVLLGAYHTSCLLESTCDPF
jgi:hypothetical protein